MDHDGATFFVLPVYIWIIIEGHKKNSLHQCERISVLTSTQNAQAFGRQSHLHTVS